MTKKQKTKTETVETPKAVAKQPKVETPVMEIPKFKTKKSGPEDGWEIKNRTYFIKGKAKRSLSRSIRGSGIYYFDEEKGYER